MSTGKTAYDLLKRSVFVIRLDSGSCNGCDIEVFDALTPYFDVERFGVKVVSSPKHADVILATGPVTRQFRRILINTYKLVPKPCVVIACGACACGGGIWYDTYAVEGGIDKVIPVDVYIPGCPPKPQAILHGVLVALQVLQQKIKRVEYLEDKEFKQKPLPLGGLVKDYEVYRDLKITSRRYLGYRLGDKLLEDYIDIARTSESISELLEKTRLIVEKWGNDPRIKEVVEVLNEILQRMYGEKS